MRAASTAADFAYGNTRLRARKHELFGASQYEALVGRDLESFLDGLAPTAYRHEVEGELAVAGKRGIEAALTRHLARALTELRGFYEGRSRELIDLLLSRFDLANLLALLRGRARDRPPEEVLANIVPIGPLGDAAGQEIARQPELARAVDLLVSWRLPDPVSARALADAWPEYQRTEDLAALEHALAATDARRVEEVLQAGPADADSLRELLAREQDAVNVLIVLRLRFALQLGELTELPPTPDGGRFLAGGTIRAEALEEALRQPTRKDAVAKLAAAARRKDWQAPLQRIGAGGDLPTLQRELEVSRVRWAVGLFHRGDPLSLDVPIAFIVAKNNEVRNLRLLAESVSGGLSPAVIRAHLIVPWEERWAS
jgi:V/A-type H+/Na+-transporting ATPase subunit C